MIDPWVQVLLTAWFGISLLISIWAYKRDMLRIEREDEQRTIDAMANSPEWIAIAKQITESIRFVRNALRQDRGSDPGERVKAAAMAMKTDRKRRPKAVIDPEIDDDNWLEL